MANKNKNKKVSDHKLSKSSAQHLKDILQDFSNDVGKKYKRGAIEHGGELWSKAGMMHNAWEEAIDLITYLQTLRFQLLCLLMDIEEDVTDKKMTIRRLRAILNASGKND